MRDFFAFTTKKYRFLGHPIEDAYMYFCQHDRAFISVADGITRDPNGIRKLPSQTDVLGWLKFCMRYPRPSPARIAANTFNTHFLASMRNTPIIDEMTVSRAFGYANSKIGHLNEKYLKHVDYLENDFWGCVACGGALQNRTLVWGYICDCGICVLNHAGKLKFRTPNDMITVSRYLNSIGKSWRDPTWRKEVRSKYRNNLKNFVNGELLSYGALTGEETAIHFVKTGTLELQKNDYVFFYTDGLDPLIFSESFRENLSNNGVISVKNFVESHSKDISGSEATIVGFIVN